VGQVIAMGVLPSGDEPGSSGRASRSSRRYDDSFRRYAVKRALEPDVRLADVANELGVSASTLRRWVRSAGGDATEGAPVASGAGEQTGEAGSHGGASLLAEPAVSEASGAEASGAEASVRGSRPADSVPAESVPPESPEVEPPESEPSVRSPSPPVPSPSAVATEESWPDSAHLARQRGEQPLGAPVELGEPVESGYSGEPGEPAAGFTAVSGSLTEAAASTAKATGHDERHVLAMLDAILDMFPRPGALPLEADLAEPGPAAHREIEAASDRIPLHPGDDIFPSLSSLLPAYRFPIILAGLLAALWVSTLVPATYELRPVAQSLHVLSLVVAFGAVLVIDWHGLLWLAGRRGLTESTRLAAGAGPLIWGGLAGLIATGALLHPNLHSPLTVTKLVLVLAVAWNGAAMSALRRRMAQLPAYVKPADLPRRDWRLMMTATVISQVGWWGAIIIGFVNSSR
jgi:transposase-like protein